MPKKVSEVRPQLETLRNLRIARGFFIQATFARHINMHPSMYNRIERGKQEPDREQMIAVAGGLGVDSRLIWP